MKPVIHALLGFLDMEDRTPNFACGIERAKNWNYSNGYISCPECLVKIKSLSMVRSDRWSKCEKGHDSSNKSVRCKYCYPAGPRTGWHCF